MTGMQRFGDPRRFEIAACWRDDPEPRDRRPAEFGWSMGELRISLLGIVLTGHRIHGRNRDAVHWYLGPVVSWLINQWKWLLHEEAYDWPTRYGESAAVAVAAQLEQHFAADFPPHRDIYRRACAWRDRHALRAADPSALYPDVFMRRVDDSIEVSWLGRQPDFAPDGYELNLKPGSVLLPVDEVARPLWEFLQWAVASANPADPGDRAQADDLRSRLDRLGRTGAAELEAAHVSDASLRAIMKRVRTETRWKSQRTLVDGIPAVAELDAPALMFGGLNINFGENDVRALMALLQRHRGEKESKALQELVSSPSIFEYIHPYAHGYDLATEARDALGIPPDQAHVDIEAILGNHGILIDRQALDTKGIRGVAIAGEDFSPAIVLNQSSAFNRTGRGRRFTLAHEFCHILYDRSHARRLSHISGPWAPGRVEKRANAFAAMFLASTHALSRHWDGSPTPASLNRLAEKFGISTKALTEHMRNLDLITADQYEELEGRRH